MEVYHQFSFSFSLDNNTFIIQRKTYTTTNKNKDILSILFGRFSKKNFSINDNFDLKKKKKMNIYICI